MKTLLAILFLFSINISHSAETQKGLGKILVPKKSLNLPYEYYVTIQKSDGQVLAFPLKSKSVKLSDLKKDQLYLLEFTPNTEKLTIGEKTQDFTIIQLSKAKALSTTDLGTINNLDNIQQNAPQALPGKKHLRLNDKLTNSIILTAGALLLGSIIAD